MYICISYVCMYVYLYIYTQYQGTLRLALKGGQPDDQISVVLLYLLIDILCILYKCMNV